MLHNLLGIMDKNSPGYRAGTYPMTEAYPDHTPIYTQDAAAKYQVTELPNGVRILTETETFPNSINLGILFHTGTRDESAKATGQFHALKNTFMKSNTRTNE
jgi:predicted Zn-dependent peptidase